MQTKPLRHVFALLSIFAISMVATASDFKAGLRNLSVPYYGSQIEVQLWFPTTAKETVQNFGPYAPSVALGASLAEAQGGVAARGRFPLVLVSHGTGGNGMLHHLQAEALARAGFVVVSFTHPGDNFQDRSLIADKRYFVERPRQLSRVLDAVLASPEWGDQVDARRIGVIGHSAGGYTVAALMGAVPDITRLMAHCQTVADYPGCALRDPGMYVTPSNKVPFKLPDSVSAEGSVSDKRVRAVVMLAPLGMVIQQGSLKSTRADVLLIGAEHDEVLPTPYHFDVMRAELPQSGKVAARIALGAGHMSFTTVVRPEWKDRLGPVAMDPPGFDRAALNAALSQELVAFFQQALAP